MRYHHYQTEWILHLRLFEVFLDSAPSVGHVVKNSLKTYLSYVILIIASIFIGNTGCDFNYGYRDELIRSYHIDHYFNLD